jgi:ABC-2 type transport system permease protein
MVDLVLIIPPSFGANLRSLTRQPEIQIIIDGSNSLVAGTLSRAAQGILAHFQAQQLAAMGVVRSSTGGIDLSAISYYNPWLDFRHSALPAQLGLIVYMVTMLVASLGITRERERGTMEQLTVAPIRKIELMIGKATPVLVIALADFVIMLAVVTSVYAIPLRGSVYLLIGLTMLYITVEMSVGLIVSSVARSQQQSLLVVFLIGVMNIAFSGYIVPVENMPWLLGKLSTLFPVQHYMTILRGIMLKGAGLPALWGEVLALAALGIVITTSAYAVLQRRLD